MNRETIKISVRNLVEFILRSGDIDNRHGSGFDMEAMQAGSRLHRKIQKRMGSHYQAEVMLKLLIPYDDFDIMIEGRADGIFAENGETVIDEIKGVYLDLDYLDEPVFVHKAQAMCYAYMYALKEEKQQIQVQMTYGNLETEDIRRFKESFSFVELEKWFYSVMEKYYVWALFQYQWRQKRNASIRSTGFPFAYRDGQKELAASVYRTIYLKKRLFIQAPTGVGKTISTLFPAVKAVGEGLGEKIFYLTAKTITRAAAMDAFGHLMEQGLSYKVVMITAKEKLCFLEETDCNPVSCPYAKGHYDRINEAAYQLLNSTDMCGREEILAGARKFQVCPFELCLDVTTWADAVVCDYNYVFDPRVSLKRFFAEGMKGDYLFLVDEAHNLVERGREMYSAALYKEDFLQIKRLVTDVSKSLARKLERCNRQFLELRKTCDDYQVVTDIGSLVLSLMNLAGALETYLEEAEASPVRKEILNLYFDVRTFLAIYEELDDNYVVYIEHTSGNRFRVKLLCVDTSANLRKYMDKSNSTVLFSATLLPVVYYRDLLTADENDYVVYADSPFDPGNRLLLIGSDVSSKYTRRGPAEYARMAGYIKAATEKKTGNYIVFFPSYKMLEDVYEAYDQQFGANIGIVCIKQGPYMNETDREDFLKCFTDTRDETLIGFCILGGIFSEGIDLKNEALIGTIIIGTGLPQVCYEREILKEFYNAREMDGFAYAYRYPGMNKVLQAAGRVIRTVTDRGFILLLDDRFLMDEYRRLFPKEWLNIWKCSQKNVGGVIEDFWNEPAKNN